MRSKLFPLLFVLAVFAGCSDNLPVNPTNLTPSLLFSYGPFDAISGSVISVETMGADGSNQHTVLYDRGLTNAPRNGRMVTLGPVSSDTGTIQVSDLDGMHRVTVENYGVADTIDGSSVVLSNDASMIAYVLISPTPVGRASDVDTLFLKSVAGGTRVMIDTGISPGSIPAFSPDGTYLAYFVGREAGIGTGTIRVRNIRTMEKPSVLPYAFDVSGDGNMMLSWAPSGDKFLCTLLESIMPQIIEVSLPDFSVHPLKPGYYPTYSPDGSMIAFVATDSVTSSSNIRIMDTRGTVLHTFIDTTEMGAWLYPNWSRDGRRIVCTSITGSSIGTGSGGAILDLATEAVTKFSFPDGNIGYRFFWK